MSITKSESEFITFHNSNPQVWIEFDRIVKRELKKIKPPQQAKFSHNSILEEIRRNKKVKTTTMRTIGRKIDRNYSAWYARYYMRRNPELGKIFSIRKMKGEDRTDNEKGGGHVGKRQDNY